MGKKLVVILGQKKAVAFAVQATGNSMAVSRVLSPCVARVVIANPLQVKTIAYSHVKTDKIDAGTLASLHAAGYLPEIWTPDAVTERKRRLVARRYQVVRHRTRIKNEVHSIMYALSAVSTQVLGDLVGLGGGGINLSEHIEADGATVFRHACRLGCERIVSKRRDAPYQLGQGPDLDQGAEPASPAIARVWER